MADVFDKAKRSKVMSRIRGRGNRDTELALVKLMRRQGIKGWRRHQSVPGRPDFIFRAAGLAIFVDGCFWHGCPMHSSIPSNNRAFWKNKLETNKKRDRIVTNTLRAEGWKVLRVWEHELTPRNEKRLLGRLRRYLLF